MKNVRRQKLWHMMVLLLFVAALSVNASAASKPAKVSGLKVAASEETKHALTWNKVKNASGYVVYAKVMVDGTLKTYKKYITGNTNGCVLKNRKLDTRYTYRVRAYKTVKGKKVLGNLSARKSIIVPKVTDDGIIEIPDSAILGLFQEETEISETEDPVPVKGIIENPTYEQKVKKIFGSKTVNRWYEGSFYKTQAAASRNMKTITVKTWDFVSGTSGKKYTRTWSLTVHKNIASTVQQMFKELYEGKEKFPIHALGGFRYESGNSEHNIGTAIDINWDENYMIDKSTGYITAGSFWSPKTNPYSIPKYGELARIFKKYGFQQGLWSDTKDYMHFSYFGT